MDGRVKPGHDEDSLPRRREAEKEKIAL